MKPTILIDLDDTLLVNDINTFVPAYLQALSTELKSLANPQQLVSTLLAATKRMVENRKPDCTLKEIFDAAFYPVLGLEIGRVQADIDRFYAEVFPGLRGLTSPRPEAKRLVEDVMARDYRVAVTTNPLFPRTAIYQRLDWAGLSPEKYPFDLITSYETFHFAKPQVAYYAEVLGRLGWPEGPVVMVGNDLTLDIAPARKLGLAAFWITPQNGSPPPNTVEPPTAYGELDSLLPWLDGLPAESLQADYTAPAAMLATLRATPAVFHSTLQDVPLEAWSKRGRSDEWSLTEILCHLRDVEAEVNLPRLQMVLQQHNPFLAGKDTDPWAEERLYICQNGPQALHRFTTARLDLLSLLEAARPEDWQRPARHAILGPTHLAELVGIIATHDRLHVRQAYHDLLETSFS